MAWPWSLDPQHATVESVLTPHAWLFDTLTCLKVPDGGGAWTNALPPQQTT